jgi:uncharacterized membrane protein
MDPKAEPRNPFYVLLVVVSLLFVVTALAYALVPALEQKAADAGSPPPPSPIRDSLRSDGWLWLLCEGAAIVVLALLSMGLDRWRRWRCPPEPEHVAAPASPADGPPPTVSSST